MMSSSAPYQIAAFYHFAPVDPARVESLAEKLEKLGNESGLRGLIISATEGINGTISGESREAVSGYLHAASRILDFPPLTPKWSESAAWPFRKFKVRVRREIVTLGKPEVQPLAPKSPTHLSPDEWDRAIEAGAVVIDTRNWYETRIGKFKGALDPQIEEFRDFSAYLDRAKIEKEQKILIYCTGGIRCEKALVEMNNKGFANVFQLDGGILNYLAHKSSGNFEGECFVFDQRVAVDQELQPTRLYKMCPHCGQPADHHITCSRCETEAVICDTCARKDEALRTCSKNCAHHSARSPGKKGRHQYEQ